MLITFGTILPWPQFYINDFDKLFSKNTKTEINSDICSVKFDKVYFKKGWFDNLKVKSDNIKIVINKDFNDIPLNLSMIDFTNISCIFSITKLFSIYFLNTFSSSQFLKSVKKVKCNNILINEFIDLGSVYYKTSSNKMDGFIDFGVKFKFYDRNLFIEGKIEDLKINFSIFDILSDINSSTNPTLYPSKNNLIISVKTDLGLVYFDGIFNLHSKAFNLVGKFHKCSNRNIFIDLKGNYFDCEFLIGLIKEKKHFMNGNYGSNEYQNISLSIKNFNFKKIVDSVLSINILNKDFIYKKLDNHFIKSINFEEFYGEFILKDKKIIDYLGSCKDLFLNLFFDNVKITDMTGNANFRKNTLDYDFNSAKINGFLIKKGNLKIENIDEPDLLEDTKIEVISSAIAKNAFDIISTFVQNSGAKNILKRINGTEMSIKFTGHVMKDSKFLFDVAVNSDQILLFGDPLDNDCKNKFISFYNIGVVCESKYDSISVKGEGVGLDLSISDDPKFMEIIVDAKLHPSDLQVFGIKLNKYFDNRSKLDLHLNYRNDIWNIELDMKDAKIYIPQVNFYKDFEVESIFKFSSKDLNNIEQFYLFQKNDVIASGSILMNEKNDILKADVKTYIFKNNSDSFIEKDNIPIYLRYDNLTNFKKSKILNNKFYLTIDTISFQDIMYLFRNFSKQVTNFMKIPYTNADAISDFHESEIFNIALSIGKITKNDMEINKFKYNVIIRRNSSNVFVDQNFGNGRVEKYSDKKSFPFYMFFNKQQKMLEIFSKNAGILLKFFNISRGFDGGILSVKMQLENLFRSRLSKTIFFKNIYNNFHSNKLNTLNFTKNIDTKIDSIFNLYKYKIPYLSDFHTTYFKKFDKFAILMSHNILKTQKSVLVKLEILDSDFNIRDANIVTKVLSGGLSISAVKSFFNKITSANIISEFHISHGTIFIEKFSIDFLDTCITGNGRVDYIKNCFTHWRGELIPFHNISKIINFIPFASVLNPDGKGIVSMSYTITGNVNSPKINIKPLSMLLPRIFNAKSNKTNKKYAKKHKKNIHHIN
jgi:hypothetical protein